MVPTASPTWTVVPLDALKHTKYNCYKEDYKIMSALISTTSPTWTVSARDTLNHYKYVRYKRLAYNLVALFSNAGPNWTVVAKDVLLSFQMWLLFTELCVHLRLGSYCQSDLD